jgi:hypothetical protein
MTNTEDIEAQPTRPRIRLRFSLLALLAFVTIISLLLAKLVQPRRVVATALFQIDSSPTLTFGQNGATSLSDREFETLKNTQLALLKSDFLLTAAIRNPKIASLAILNGKADQVAWLKEHLEVGFPESSEILTISIHGTESQGPDLVPLVDAVAKAYMTEVISEKRQQRLATRDLIARNLENINQEIRRKMDEFLDIARESGRTDNGSGQLLQDLDIKRLDRVENEVMKLEGDLVISTGDATKAKSVGDRIAQLKEQQSDLVKRLTARAERSTEMETRKRDLERLQQIAGELSVRLEQLDIEASLPDRIRQVQAAAVSSEK